VSSRQYAGSWISVPFREIGSRREILTLAWEVRRSVPMPYRRLSYISFSSTFVESSPLPASPLIASFYSKDLVNRRGGRDRPVSQSDDTGPFPLVRSWPSRLSSRNCVFPFQARTPPPCSGLYECSVAKRGLVFFLGSSPGCGPVPRLAHLILPLPLFFAPTECFSPKPTAKVSLGSAGGKLPRSGTVVFNFTSPWFFLSQREAPQDP